MLNPVTLTVLSVVLIAIALLGDVGKKKYVSYQAARTRSRAQRAQLGRLIDEFYRQRTESERDARPFSSTTAEGAGGQGVSQFSTSLYAQVCAILSDETMGEIERVGRSVHDWNTSLKIALGSRVEHDYLACRLVVASVRMDLFALEQAIRDTVSGELRRDRYVIWGIYLLIAAHGGRLAQWKLEDVRTLNGLDNHTHNADRWLSKHMDGEMHDLSVLVSDRMAS